MAKKVAKKAVKKAVKKAAKKAPAKKAPAKKARGEEGRGEEGRKESAGQESAAKKAAKKAAKRSLPWRHANHPQTAGRLALERQYSRTLQARFSPQAGRLAPVFVSGAPCPSARRFFILRAIRKASSIDCS